MKKDFIEENYNIKLLCSKNADSAFAAEIMYGIEEEGLFSEIIIKEKIDLNNSFEQVLNKLCISSPLGIAAGISEHSILVSVKKFEPGMFLFRESTSSTTEKQARLIGHNVARFVICKPFLYHE